MFLDDFNIDRQPEIAVEIGNTYNTETVTDSIEIATANLAFTTM